MVPEHPMSVLMNVAAKASDMNLGRFMFFVLEVGGMNCADEVKTVEGRKSRGNDERISPDSFAGNRGGVLLRMRRRLA